MTEKKMTVRKLKSSLVNGEELTHCYCRKCMQVKTIKNFYTATDTYLDKNGYMSVCKQCVDDIYRTIYSVEKNVSASILRVCRILNIKYDEKTIDSTLLHINTLAEKQTSPEEIPIIGIYRAKLVASQPEEIGRRTEQDLTFREPNQPISKTTPDEEELIDEEIFSFWGEGYSIEDYAWLEKTLDEWKKTHKSDTKAEESLLREIVWKEYDIRKARQEGKSTASLVKELQDLMKTASVDPAKTAIANSGKAFDTFGEFIKQIEETEPAEYWKEPELYKDFFGTEQYYQDYVVRPLRNFITNSRDFTLSEEGSEDVDDDLDFDDVMPEEG